MYRTIEQTSKYFSFKTRREREFTVLVSLGPAIVSLDLDSFLSLYFVFKKVPIRVRGYKYNKPWL